MIIGLIGRQSNAVPVPVKQILGGPVPPVHGGPFGRVGVELAEKMVFAMIEAKAVGIVDPSARRQNVIAGAIGIDNGFRQFRYRLIGTLNREFHG